MILKDQFPVINKKRTCHLVDFAIQANSKIKIPAPCLRAEKAEGNKKVTVIAIIAGSLGKDCKVLEKCLAELGIRGRIETVQTVKISYNI